MMLANYERFMVKQQKQMINIIVQLYRSRTFSSLLPYSLMAISQLGLEKPFSQKVLTRTK